MDVHSVKVTAKGQITLPKPIRDQLRIKDGDYLEARIQNGMITLKPAVKNNGQALLIEYATQQSQPSPSLAEVREILRKTAGRLSEQVREAREEEAAGD